MNFTEGARGVAHSSFTGIAQRWKAAMLRGDFEAAWIISDELLRTMGPLSHERVPRHLRRTWDGTSLVGRRVLVRCYHGLGDTIQFVRYIPALRRIASEVILCAQPSLLELLSTISADVHLIPLHDGAPGVTFDAEVEIMELPHAFRTTLTTLPAEVPYLHVPPAQLSTDQRPAVGLVWKAGDWDDRRSLDVEELLPAISTSGASLHALQPEACAREWWGEFAAANCSSSVYKTAMLIRALDLVITVDTMVAHLAGALGRPVWLMLHADADWRWMRHRIDSPWYPTMRLFRQQELGDWGPVVKSVAGDLAELTLKLRRQRLVRGNQPEIGCPPTH